MIDVGDAQPSNRLIHAESIRADDKGDTRDLSADSDGQLPTDCLILLGSAYK